MDGFTFLLYVTVSDMNTDDSSDNEPLIKIAKVSSKAAKKPFSVPPKRTVDTKKKGKIFFFSPWTCSNSRKLVFSVANTYS